MDVATIKMLRLVLTDLNMKLAYDDFGAGQARLNELVEARPDYLKFDRKLIAGLNSANTSRQQLVQSLVTMSKQLGITTLAEGVETAEEAAACKQIGFELMQGFYFGKPAKFESPPIPVPAEVLGGMVMLSDADQYGAASSRRSGSAIIGHSAAASSAGRQHSRPIRARRHARAARQANDCTLVARRTAAGERPGFSDLPRGGRDHALGRVGSTPQEVAAGMRASILPSHWPQS